jgi:hypothetical protein
MELAPLLEEDPALREPEVAELKEDRPGPVIVVRRRSGSQRRRVDRGGGE